MESENRLKNLEHVRERLDELEQIVTYYQTDFNYQKDEETSIGSDDERHLRTHQQQTIHNTNDPQQLDKISIELAAKRL